MGKMPTPVENSSRWARYHQRGTSAICRMKFKIDNQLILLLIFSVKQGLEEFELLAADS
jgi:hypothetical protein